MDNMIKELKTYGADIALPKFYSWLKKLGIGFTPVRRISKRINPFDENIPILAKLEYTNFGESIKARPFAMMHYRNLISGKLSNKTEAIAATSGNFGLAGSYLLRDEANFTVYMSEKAIKENKGLTTKLQENKTKIETFSDRYCPTVAAKRGEAIAAARYVEKTDLETINYDQYEDIGNPLSHFLTTAPEIHHQTNGRITHFITSLGTCGTMIGCGDYLREAIPKTKIIGLIPQENHHQLGLRSRDELGATRFFEEAKELCDEIIQVSDKDAYNTMLKLWKAQIPIGISSGANCYGASKVAEQLHDENKKGLIITIIPDSCENYAQFLRTHLQNVTGLEFAGAVNEKFGKLKIKAQEERREHILRLKNGRTTLFKTMRKNALDSKHY
ncbi:MAG: pyridoxal-phosphate dependent enzyme [Candidatus Thorarchaeota archaeon]|nr:pyridoxal-phosphate dependent enzyme [Candidatus Thorarchaeota archaeon]